MNIIEAIKSGKPFRRVSMAPWNDAWITADMIDDGSCSYMDCVNLGTAGLIADDWEIKDSIKQSLGFKE